MLFGNDVRDDAEMTEIAQVDPDGQIVAVSGTEQTLFTYLARLTYLGRLLRKSQLQLAWMWQHRGEQVGRPVFEFVEENPDLTDLTDGYLRRLVSEVEESGSQLVLTAVPSRDDILRRDGLRTTGVFHDTVQAWAERHTVPFVDLSTPFATAADAGAQLFFARDIHFTAEGHRVVADAILVEYPEVFGGVAR